MKRQQTRDKSRLNLLERFEARDGSWGNARIGGEVLSKAERIIELLVKEWGKGTRRGKVWGWREGVIRATKSPKVYRLEAQVALHAIMLNLIQRRALSQ